jgi:hypothetical protein
MSEPPTLETVVVSSHSVLLRWAAEGARFEVQWRSAHETEWQAVDDIVAKEFKVLDLRPETAYLLRVRQAERGAEPGPFSEPVEVQTPKHVPRCWHGFEIVEPVHVPTFEGGKTSYPCLASHKGDLYLFERLGTVCSRKDDLSAVPGDWLALSKITEDGQVLWTKEVVPSPTPRGPYCYQGLLNAHVVRDTLFLYWNKQPTGQPDYKMAMSEQLLRTCNLVTGETSEILSVPSDDPAAGVWAGGVTSIGGDVWVSYLKTYEEGERLRTQIALRKFQDDGFGPEFVWKEAPTSIPYAALLASFNDQVVILFPDLQHLKGEEGREPLYAISFDGKDFHDLTLISGAARSRYAKAVEWQDELVIAFKTDERYHDRYGYQFHDIGLVAWNPKTGAMDRGFFVEEMRYLSSPNPIVHNGAIWLAYMRVQSLECYHRTSGAFLGALRPT